MGAHVHQPLHEGGPYEKLLPVHEADCHFAKRSKRKGGKLQVASCVGNQEAHPCNHRESLDYTFDLIWLNSKKGLGSFVLWFPLIFPHIDETCRGS